MNTQKKWKRAKKNVVRVDRTPDLSKSILKSSFSRTLSQLSYPDFLLIEPQMSLHIAILALSMRELLLNSSSGNGKVTDAAAVMTDIAMLLAGDPV